MTAPAAGALVDLGEAIGRWVLWAVLSLVNVLVMAVGGLLSGIEALFPNLPDVPSPPSGNGGFIGALSWIYPWGALVALMASAVTIWLGFLAVKVIARWVKAL